MIFRPEQLQGAGPGHGIWKLGVCFVLLYHLEPVLLLEVHWPKSELWSAKMMMGVDQGWRPRAYRCIFPPLQYSYHCLKNQGENDWKPWRPVFTAHKLVMIMKSAAASKSWILQMCLSFEPGDCNQSMLANIDIYSYVIDLVQCK